MISLYDSKNVKSIYLIRWLKRSSQKFDINVRTWRQTVYKIDLFTHLLAHFGIAFAIYVGILGYTLHRAHKREQVHLYPFSSSQRKRGYWLIRRKYMV